MSRIKAIVLDAVRHAVPLVALYVYHGSVPAYLLLTAFDLALGLMLIVGTTRDAKDPTTVDPRAAFLVSRITFEAATRVGERGTSLHAGPVVGDLARDRRTAKAAYAAQVTLIGVYVGLAYGLSALGHRGLFILPLLYAGLLVFFDARPDIGQRIFPDLWRESRRK
ncbi:MAG: hypothetical protein QOD64_1923 [Verrucomicrobiota bacterium]|jgi:hypothetical protein